MDGVLGGSELMRNLTCFMPTQTSQPRILDASVAGYHSWLRQDEIPSKIRESAKMQGARPGNWWILLSERGLCKE